MELTNVALNSAVIAVATIWITWHAKGRSAEFRAEMHKGFEDLGARIARLEERHERLEDRIGALDEKMDARFTGLENRFDTRITDLENRFDTRITGLENRFDTRITGSERNVNERMNGLQASVDTMRSDLTLFIQGWPPRAENA